MISLKYKKIDRLAVAPIQSEGNAGLDLTAIHVEHNCGFHEYDTGIAVEIPEGYMGLLFPRSSISKTNLILANSVGLVDSSYRGTIRFRFKDIRNTSKSKQNIYKLGDKVGQLVVLPYPTIHLIESNELSETSRGEKGFGSTGN